MKKNIKDSIIFNTILRHALIQIVEFNTDRNTNSFKNFILNECTDYELLYYAINNNFPKEKYNIKEERKLINKLNNILKESKISEDFKINKFVSLTENKLSSSKVIMEFNNLQEEVVGQQGAVDPKMVSRAVSTSAAIMLVRKGLEKGLSAWPAISKYLPYVSLPIILASMAMVAYRLYKRYYSRAGLACKNFSGIEKNNCLKEYEIKALEMEISELLKGIPACGKTKNPELCKSKLTKIINKKKLKLEFLKKGTK